MAFSPNFADLVRNYTTSMGTDDFVLGGAVNGFTSFTDACKVGDCFYYSAVAVDYPGDTEVGRGSLLDGGVISREPFNGTKTDFKSGTKSVSLVAAGEWFADVETLRANGVGMISVKSFGAKGDSDQDGVAGTDDTAAIQAAINHVASLGGGTVYFPEGHYKVSSYLSACGNLRFLGAGQKASWLVTAMAGGGGASTGESLRNGSVIYSNWPSNGSNQAHLAIEHIGFRCSNINNQGAAFYDNCGSSIQIRNCVAYGFKYSLVFDQSELVDVSQCDLSAADAGGACVWLVNGSALRAGNAGTFTNRISIKSCQINAGGSVHGILDDGGNVHSFVDNNYNGCLHHIRAAGVLGLKISGGEFESALGANVLLSNLTLSGSAVGGCDVVCIDTPEFSPTGGQSCISVVDGNMGSMTLIAPFFGNSTAPKVSGTGAIYALYSMGAENGGGGPTFDRQAQNHWEVGNNGLGAIAITTNLAQADIKTADVDWCRANGPGIPTAGFGLELIHNGQTGNGGLASIVAYDRSLSEWQTLQVGASAIKLQTGGNDVAVLDSSGMSVTGKISASDLVATAKGLGTSYLLAQSAVPASHSGDTNEVVLASVTVPANSMGANGRIQVEARLTLSNTASSKTVNLKFGGTTFATKVQSGAAIDSLQGDVANRGDPAVQVGSAQFYSGNSMSTNGVSTGAADTSQDQILSISAQLASAADTVTLESYRFILHPAD